MDSNLFYNLYYIWDMKEVNCTNYIPIFVGLLIWGLRVQHLKTAFCTHNKNNNDQYLLSNQEGNLDSQQAALYIQIDL